MRTIAFMAAGQLLLVLGGCAQDGNRPSEQYDEDAGLDAFKPSSNPFDTWEMPRYDDGGDLLRPPGTEQWVFLGSSLNLNYGDDGMPYAFDIMGSVFMEPSAFRHFQATGEFREGTMTALRAYTVKTDTPPAMAGEFADTFIAFEMSVKDSNRFPQERWAYYSFPVPNADRAPANAPETCFSCHDEHASTDHVFAQFYPVIR